MKDYLAYLYQNQSGCLSKSWLQRTYSISTRAKARTDQLRGRVGNTSGGRQYDVEPRGDVIPGTKGFTLWLTGLPCAGKSTLASMIARELRQRSCRVDVLDADVLRTTLCKGLGFSKSDRDENVARIGEACVTLNRHGVTAIAAAVSPYREARGLLRNVIPTFVEIFVRAPLAVCIERDVKGMYAKALSGRIANFTGINDPYEEPLDADLVIETAKSGVELCVESVLEHVEQRGLLALHGGQKDSDRRNRASTLSKRCVI